MTCLCHTLTHVNRLMLVNRAIICLIYENIFKNYIHIFFVEVSYFLHLISFSLKFVWRSTTPASQRPKIILPSNTNAWQSRSCALLSWRCANFKVQVLEIAACIGCFFIDTDILYIYIYMIDLINKNKNIIYSIFRFNLSFMYFYISFNFQNVFNRVWVRLTSYFFFFFLLHENLKFSKTLTNYCNISLQ